MDFFSVLEVRLNELVQLSGEPREYFQEKILNFLAELESDFHYHNCIIGKVMRDDEPAF